MKKINYLQNRSEALKFTKENVQPNEIKITEIRTLFQNIFIYFRYEKKASK